mmetsp:Transcript_59076/g.129401  ORF Transcript_59076/g.129401 Transcript_59076/m.129401 type:complete len:704 (+) Transcript_59076:26-2137(+)|eukprot:CAMPEP_0204325076 /NCGR_PEP_ID=MMETSP0469-20131031/10730_1 /ASSEMBLY_ACC=CAM_ASM_000384 /TAXON_ID=2969 /ORGANISM="Oxyrrhis marina" /LENGTH=703 /DNA_ID=CAMNT_0051306855 /DNA_START=21 /DNA_END=2132 /DNA_ORIENTATION=+
MLCTPAPPLPVDPSQFVVEDCQAYSDAGCVDAPFVTNANARRKIKWQGKEGYAGAKPVTFGDLLRQGLKRRPGDIVLVQPEATDCGVAVERKFTMQQYCDESRALAKALIAAGVQQCTGVGILGFNSPEWFFANNGAILSGALASGVYPTQTEETTMYQLNHCRASVVLCDDRKQLTKLMNIRAKCTQLKYIVIWREGVEAADNKPGQAQVLTYAEFLKLGEKVLDADLDARTKQQTPENAATLIYTSGTTGMPKAVMISHDNVTWTAGTIPFQYDVGTSIINYAEQHQIISYLPLSHIAGAMVDIYMPLWLNAFHSQGCCVTFARPDALKGTLKQTLQAVRPTLFFGVPRVWEKFEAAIKEIGAANTGVKKMVGDWSKEMLKWTNTSRQVGEAENWSLLEGVASKVMGAVKAALGLDRAIWCGTGAAPIHVNTLEYFASLDIMVTELYGMSECTGPHTVSTKNLFKFGTCGPMLPGCESRIDFVAGRDKEGEGELFYRGRHVMMGYMDDDEKSRATIDKDGWLATGDVVSIKSYGEYNGKPAPEFVKITGRVKELIITAGGENIPPVLIEDAVKEQCSALGNVMAIGDQRKFLTMLVAAKVKENPADGSATEELIGEALALDPACTTVSQAKNSEIWKKAIDDAITKYNKEKAISQAQKIQKWVLIPTTFTVAGGELGPTLKLKRGPTMEKYANLITGMYGE